MKTIIPTIAAVCLLGLAGAQAAAPLRVLLLPCEDATGTRPDSQLVPSLQQDTLARKAALLVGKRLVRHPGYVLLDRPILAADAATRPSVDPIRQAQLLGADLVVRPSLLTLSTSSVEVNQGGYQTRLWQVRVRVVLSALDVVDGSVIAMGDGVSTRDVRQTGNVTVTLGEDELLELLGTAFDEGIPPLVEALAKRASVLAQQPKVKLTVRTSEDPALVEVDGLLVGTTPLEGYQLYSGDHVIAIGKGGYRDVTKRVLLDRDLDITIPMQRVELTMEELRDIATSTRWPEVQYLQPAWIIQPSRQPE